MLEFPAQLTYSAAAPGERHHIVRLKSFHRRGRPVRRAADEDGGDDACAVRQRGWGRESHPLVERSALRRPDPPVLPDVSRVHFVLLLSPTSPTVIRELQGRWDTPCPRFCVPRICDNWTTPTARLRRSPTMRTHLFLFGRAAIDCILFLCPEES